ncbi:hypothetical protein GFS31_38030 [Leptolyngbya sp. BL0902]|uniref:hypothetical protein n=1 Tax=Leptolyngbya sp. BL0902 TaxID=1115757 RepID=UPI0018E81307|nr:hypothetical protein [Leptolyngbya sp. BL0902]QQE67096.1 hypothetical protein GFS31_38030 [Leptolyngbya sp. BL0902]
MKLAWPSHRLHRWSRRLISFLSFALAACFLSISLAVPVGAVAPSPTTEIGPAWTSSLPEETLLAQVNNTQRNVLVFNTPTYAVRVFIPAGSTVARMNVFRRTAPTELELNAQPASFRGAITSDGFLTYESFGSRFGRNVIFRASHNRGSRQARLEILDEANEQVIFTEFASGIDAPQMPEAPITGALERNTLLGFETANYAVRVFRDPADNLRKMNIYFKQTSTTLVNGQVATPETSGNIPGYECWISYFGGTQFNGVSARYHARVNAGGQAVLEIIGTNGALLLSEARINTIPLTVNVPIEDRPACFVGGGIPGAALAPFVAAVFGEQRELDAINALLDRDVATPRRLTTCTVSPRFENARQGQFINAAECTDRSQAEAMVSYLRSAGFNSRLVYRNFRYR